jgi:endonuclease G
MLTKPPPIIAEGARARLASAMPQIRHSMTAIEEGRPGDAETEVARRVQVFQARTGVSLEEADRKVSRSDGGAERIWGQTVDFVDVAFFERGRQAARAVARIITTDGAPLGTGFLISPHLLMTNNHVIDSESAAAGLLAEFDYERDMEGVMLPVTRFAFDPDACFLTNGQDNLDYTVIAMGRRSMGNKELTSFGYLPVSNARNKHQLGDFVNIIQHADGRPKEAVIRENQLVARTGTTLDYVADTEPGASGSPVCNVMWRLVALHHWGSPHRELTDENGKPIPKTVNEGIRASSIYTDLTTLRTTLKPGPEALIDEALRVGLESTPTSSSGETRAADRAPGAGSDASLVIANDGTATWTFPLSVSVKLGGLPSAPASNPVISPVVSGQPSTGSAEAKLELDPNYSSRSGYDPNFLLDASIELPKLSPAQTRDAARNSEAGRGDDPYELKYHHYSVVMNGKRRLAFVSAVNIDGNTSKDFNRSTGAITDPMAGGDEADDSEASELWFPERRIQEREQTPRDFYEGQTAFDARGNPILDRRSGGHRNRMFQKGHLTRRQDPIWGDDDQLVRYANADTFHVTNCSPQVGFFNMGIRKRPGSEAKAKSAVHPGGDLYWRALEEYVLANARADRKKVSVFTGCVFDEANDIPWDRGRQDMRGFKAPKKFWKLVLRVEGGAPQATALVADQSPLIDVAPEALLRGEALTKPFPYEKVAQYHYSVDELEQLTGLDFGNAVHSADTYQAQGRGAGSGRREVRKIEDVTLTRAPRRPAKAAKSRRAARKVPKKRR